MPIQPFSPHSASSETARPTFGDLIGESADLLGGFGIMFLALAPFALPFILLVVAVSLVVIVPSAAVGVAGALVSSPVLIARRFRSHQHLTPDQPVAEVVRTRPTRAPRVQRVGAGMSV